MSLGLGLHAPRKRQDISGVSATSMVDLKANLYKMQEDAKRAKLTGEPMASARPSRVVILMKFSQCSLLSKTRE
jgi:hypothetical protein